MFEGFLLTNEGWAFFNLKSVHLNKLDYVLVFRLLVWRDVGLERSYMYSIPFAMDRFEGFNVAASYLFFYFFNISTGTVPI